MNDSPTASTINRGQLALQGGVSDDTGVTSVTLSCELRDTIVEFLRRCLPQEGVGVLATRRSGSSLTAVRFYVGRNIDRSPQRYTMDPAGVLLALADMKREKTRLGAIVHSHPNTSPVPSRTDLVEATLPGVLSLIVGLSPVALRAWRLVCDSHGVAVRFDEVPVVYHDTCVRQRVGFLKGAGHYSGKPEGPVKGST